MYGSSVILDREFTFGYIGMISDEKGTFKFLQVLKNSDFVNKKTKYYSG